MKKTIEVIKKNENIFIILLIVLSLLGVVISVSLKVGDELWNFQNVYKMYNGFQIYKDANVICTPLFFYIGNIIFDILGANYFIFRIYNILIFTFYYFMIYKILRELKIGIKASTVCTLILIMLGTYVLPRIMANYNSLAVAFALLGIYLLIKNKCIIDTKNIIAQSIICFLVILTKQNIGLFYLISLTIIILAKKGKNKITGVLLEAGVFIVLSALFLIFLETNGLLYGFINYTILGMKQFASYNVLISLSYILADISILAVNLCTSIFLVKQTKIKINKEERDNLFVLNCFSIAISLLIYPIVNLTHFLLAINIAIILLIYISYIICKKSHIKLKKVNSLLTTFLIILILVDIGINTYRFAQWRKEILKDDYPYNYEEPYYGAIIDDEMVRDIEKVTNYIVGKENEGKNVIVFSSKAALYMVPLKQSNGFYDLPFNGNLGNLSEQEIVNDLKQKSNVIILIDKDSENLLWQENKNLINTIKEDFKYDGNINNFDVYIQ